MVGVLTRHPSDRTPQVRKCVLRHTAAGRSPPFASRYRRPTACLEMWRREATSVNVSRSSSISERTTWARISATARSNSRNASAAARRTSLPPAAMRLSTTSGRGTPAMLARAPTSRACTADSMASQAARPAVATSSTAASNRSRPIADLIARRRNVTAHGDHRMIAPNPMHRSSRSSTLACRVGLGQRPSMPSSRPPSAMKMEDSADPRVRRSSNSFHLGTPDHLSFEPRCGRQHRQTHDFALDPHAI